MQNLLFVSFRTQHQCTHSANNSHVSPSYYLVSQFPDVEFAAYIWVATYEIASSVTQKQIALSLTRPFEKLYGIYFLAACTTDRPHYFVIKRILWLALNRCAGRSKPTLSPSYIALFSVRCGLFIKGNFMGTRFCPQLVKWPGWRERDNFIPCKYRPHGHK